MKKYTFNLNTRNFGHVGSTIEFYSLIGFDFNGKDVRNLRMNPISNKQVLDILIRTHRNYTYKVWQDWSGIKVSLTRGNVFKPSYAERAPRFDWFNYCPVDDATLPKGVMVEYEPGDVEYKEPRVLPKR